MITLQGLLGALCPLFEPDHRRHLETETKLVDYVSRMKAGIYPKF